jgi:C-5 cytosine-specific DNA methylase
MKPLAIDLFCGLGGWSNGLIATGWDVIGFDIEKHEYDDDRYPGQLVIQDVLTLHGSQFRDADLIVASPPCQEFSYMAMPWSRAKQIAAALRGQGEFPEGYRGSRTLEDLTRLFDACFRIQREACEAAGRHIPLVVENVKGAQPWVGRANWSFGSFFLWGDIPALMPRPTRSALKSPGVVWYHPDDPRHKPGMAFNPGAQGAAVREARERAEGSKNGGAGSWFNIGSPGQTKTGGNPVHAHERHIREHMEGLKGGGGQWFNDYKSRAEKPSALLSMTSSKSPARKAASARIAMIPRPLSEWIGRVYLPKAIAA